MSNPTLGNLSQFTTPYNILPDVIYANPTTAYASQFIKPFNILPDVIYTNPTTANLSQFNKPFNILPDVIYNNPTLRSLPQFNKPFNILPDVIYDNPTTAYSSQFAFTRFESFSSNYPGYIGNPTEDIYTSKNPPPIGFIWNPGPYESANILPQSITSNILGYAAGAIGSLTGVPQVAQSAGALIGQQLSPLSNRYATLQLDQLNSIPGIKYADFRNRRILGNAQTATLIRLDGASAALRSLSGRSILFAAASANPLGGAYPIFNLDGAGQTGFGWGSHDANYAIRNDFTARSHVATTWSPIPYKNADGVTIPGRWISTINPIEIITPFRGDRVNVIDFSKRKEENAYQWRPGAILGALGKTNDFIKFYFTGPKILPGDVTNEDDIIVFRAAITSINDTFAGNWSSQTMIGRADPNYQYSGFSRDLSLDFEVYATDRDEVKFIWRKLNALASYTAPIYNQDITLAGPWMRITIGDLFRQTPVVLTSLSYALHDSETTWEINIEDDSTMMQVPHGISVSCQFNVIGNEIPQNGGKFYTLAKQFDDKGAAKRNKDNWLSDQKENSEVAVTDKWRIKRQKSTTNL
jgi:hypothetical protein